MNENGTEIPVLTKDLYFRPDENVHIQLSNEFPDHIETLHTHKYIEIAYIVSGRATHIIDGKTYHAKRGDLFIINMDTPHVFLRDQTAPDPFVAYDLMFTPAFFDQSITGDRALESLNDSFMLYSLFHGREEHPPYFSVTGGLHTMFGELFNKIYLEYRGAEKGYIELIRAYLLQLIIQIFRMDDTNGRADRVPRQKQIVDFVCNYIQEHYAMDLSVSLLAREVYLNPDYLGRIFREATGMTVSAMIQKVRIDRVCEMLIATDRTVGDIAASCGFSDMHFFYNVFKKHKAVSPGEYRVQCKS